MSPVNRDMSPPYTRCPLSTRDTRDAQAMIQTNYDKYLILYRGFFTRNVREGEGMKGMGVSPGKQLLNIEI